jgi:hypothetical protein
MPVVITIYPNHARDSVERCKPTSIQSFVGLGIFKAWCLYYNQRP